eukprot:Skav216025  [mRNA]  locus=scaffold417:118207:118826:- [translate_table: standard]
MLQVTSDFQIATKIWIYGQAHLDLAPIVLEELHVQIDVVVMLADTVGTYAIFKVVFRHSKQDLRNCFRHVAPTCLQLLSSRFGFVCRPKAIPIQVKLLGEHRQSKDRLQTIKVVGILEL